MASKKKSKVDPKTQFLVVGLLIGIPAAFIGFVFLTDWMMAIAPVLCLVLLVLVATIYTAMTSRLLYKYFGASAPWYSYIPCFGETTVMDSTYLKVCIPFYILSVVSIVLSFVPGSVFSFMPGNIGLNMPIYFMVAAVVFLGIVQIVKGVGLFNCYKFVDESCIEKLGHDMGVFRLMSIFGFIPFARLMAFYGLNTCLTKLTVFANRVIDDTDDDEVIVDD